jgi:LPS-assembly protein
VFRGIPALFLVLLTCGRVIAQVTQPAPVVNADNTSFDITTNVAVLTGHARVEYGSALLLADEIRVNQATGQVSARGNFSITSGSRRLLAASGTYNLNTGAFRLVNLRAGEPPYYFVAAQAEGTKTEMVLTGAVVTYNEPGGFSPTLWADRLLYVPGVKISGQKAYLGIGNRRLIPLKEFDQPLSEALQPTIVARAGYDHTFGAYFDLDLRLPIWPGIKLGADVGEYSARGPIAGPSGSYRNNANGQDIIGDFTSGFIRDHGTLGTDILGRNVPMDRGYFDWSHQQIIDEKLTLTGEFNWWKDSEVLRDFHSDVFNKVQQPDSFFEGVYAGDNYFIDLFTRVAPNNFELVQQRLPELRFDLVPTAIGGGFYERFATGFAALQQDSLFSGPTLRSDRFDTFYSIDRPIFPTEWLSVTPVAGGRLTYYDKAVDGRQDYTRWLGEVGVDAQLRTSGTFDYQNALWGINGLRHLFTPVLSYRYIPEIDRGQTYIPPIDTRVFSTDLQPIELGTMRNLDDLRGANVLRLGLDNLLQTRDAGYGSRDLVRFNLTSDLNLSTYPGQHHWSDVYQELAITPASWMNFSVFDRLSARTFGLHEFNSRLALTDNEWWSMEVSSTYLQHQIEQYFMQYDQRFTEVWKGLVRVRYDSLLQRWNELTFGLQQNLRNTWRVRYEVSWNHGQQREASFGLNVQVDLIRF